MKKVSIIIPIYNTDKFLEECLCSIISSKKNFEVILVDDGSTDNSGKICDKYQKKDDRIKVIHKQNGGVSSARNLGISIATGEYIMFIDSDDVLSSDWDRTMDYLKGDDIYYFDSRFGIETSKNEILKYIVGNNEQNIYISGPFKKAYKTSFIVKNKLKFDENIINGEDMLFNIEAILLASSFSIIDNNDYYYYRQMIGQATRRFDAKIINSDKMFHERLNSLLVKHNVDEDLKKEIENYCLTGAIILILNRISYIDKYSNAKKYFEGLDDFPYNLVIKSNENNSIGKRIIFYCCRKKRYRLTYNFFKIINKLSIHIKKIRKEELKKI